MICVLGLALILLLAAPAVGDERPMAVDLVEAQVRLLDRAREYHLSLERVLALQEAAAERADAQARSRREFFERGVISRRELEESERRWKTARSGIEETRKRMAEADAVMGEMLAAIELAKMPKAEDTELVVTPAVIRYQGALDPALVDVDGVANFFLRRYGRPLPVSARGQTMVHDRLGLDHRHALDVAVHPDGEEGRALIQYLRAHHIPFLAFREPIPGSSTGAHVHIGHASPQLLPVRAPFDDAEAQSAPSVASPHPPVTPARERGSRDR